MVLKLNNILIYMVLEVLLLADPPCQEKIEESQERQERQEKQENLVLAVKSLIKYNKKEVTSFLFCFGGFVLLSSVLFSALERHEAVLHCRLHGREQRVLLPLAAPALLARVQVGALVRRLLDLRRGVLVLVRPALRASHVAHLRRTQLAVGALEPQRLRRRLVAVEPLARLADLLALLVPLEPLAHRDRHLLGVVLHVEGLDAERSLQVSRGGGVEALLLRICRLVLLLLHHLVVDGVAPADAPLRVQALGAQERGGQERVVRARAAAELRAVRRHDFTNARLLHQVLHLTGKKSGKTNQFFF